MSDDIKTWTAKARTPGKKNTRPPDEPHGATPLYPPRENAGGNAGGTTGLGAGTPAPGASPSPRKRKSPPSPPSSRSPLKRVLRRLGWGVVTVLALLLCGVAWLTGPLGERTLTALTLNVANKALAPTGLRMELAEVTGLWDGEVRVMGLRLLDKDGLWLELGEAALLPRWSSVARNALDNARTLQKLKLGADPTGDGTVLLHVERVNFFDLTIERAPVLAPAPSSPPSGEQTPPTAAAPLRILPEWLDVDVDELEVTRLGLGPRESRVYANVLGNALLSDTQAEVRLGLYLGTALKNLRAAPIPEILSDDVTLSRRELEEREAQKHEELRAALPDFDANADASPSAAAAADGNTNGSAGGSTLPAGQNGAPATNGSASLSNGATSSPNGGLPPAHAQLLLNVVWDGVFADIRWQARDTLLLPRLFPGVQRLWSRARAQVNMPQWPPTREAPLQARVASRFGLTVTELPERIKASLASLQFFWDGQTLVARDVDLRIPIRDPRILVQGSAGLSRESGPGLRLRAELTDLGAVARTVGLAQLQEIVGGEVVSRFAVGRGGRHTLWWTRPLPEPEGFAENPLPGFTAAPLPPELARLEAEGLLQRHTLDDNSIDSIEYSSDDNLDNSTPTAEKRVTVTRTMHDPRASTAPTALHTRISVDSPQLMLPGGTVQGLSLVLRGTSLDADKAPDGTMRRKAVENALKNRDAQNGTGKTNAGGTPPNGAAAASAPSTQNGADSDSGDFATSGLPRGLVGKLQLKADSLFGMGDADLTAQWLLAGLHGDADVLLMEFSKLAGKLPGFRLGGDVELSYGLPLRRPWPWLDGTLEVAVDNWQALSRLIKSPVQGGGMGLNLRMESRFNEKNEPRQYLRADVQARQVDAPTFTVRGVQGNVESDHAHALADLFSLAFSPAARRKVSPDGPPPLDYDLLKARLQLGSGSGGPLQWSSGLCTLHVAGEDARIDANLEGTIRGVVEGIFNFRNRVLQIRKMEVSQSDVNRGTDGGTVLALRLRGPLRATLHEDGGLDPVDVGLTIGTAPEATARLKAVLVPLTGSNSGSPTAAPNSGMDRLLRAEALLWGLPGQDAPDADSPSAVRASIHLPLRFAPLPTPLRGAPLAAEARWQGQLEPLWKMLPLPGRSLSGAAQVQLGVAGTLDKPQLRAVATLRQGRFVDKLEGLRLQDITLNMDYGGQDLSRFQLSAADGRGGTLALRGSLFQKGPALMVNAAGSLDRLRPLHRDDLRLTLSGQWALRGPLLGMIPPLPNGMGGAASPAPVPAPGFAQIPAAASADRDPPAKPEVIDSTDALPAGPLPPQLLLSGALRLDEGSFQLLRGFAPSVASLDQVAQGSGPPPLPPEVTALLQTPSQAPSSMSPQLSLPQTAARPAASSPSFSGRTPRKGMTASTAVAAGVTKTTPLTEAAKARATPRATTAPTGGATAFVTPVPQLQLTLDAPGRLFISGKGLDSEWRAALKVEGSARAPRLIGSVSPVRGTLELLGRQFRFEQGAITFNGAWPPSPRLDLALGYQSAKITALVKVLGSALRPRLDLTSQPPLPRDEVMAQVLFGKNIENLSRFEALQAANAVRQLVDGGPASLDVLASAKDALGLQVLRLGSATSSAGTAAKSAPRDASVQGKSSDGQDLGTTLEAGKYITDSIYVGVEQGTKPEAGTAVRVEVELTPNVSLSGRTSQESSGVGLNWKMDY